MFARNWILTEPKKCGTTMASWQLKGLCHERQPPRPGGGLGGGDEERPAAQGEDGGCLVTWDTARWCPS